MFSWELKVFLEYRLKGLKGSPDQAGSYENDFINALFQSDRRIKENLKKLRSVFPKLESLTLRSWKLGYMHFRIIAQLNLKELKLDCCRSLIRSKWLSYALNGLQGSLENLSVSDISMWGSFSQIITSLATCSNLTVLDFNIGDVKYRRKLDNFEVDIEKLQYGCPKLKDLTLVGTRDYVLSLTKISPDQEAASPGFPNLERLVVLQSCEDFEVGFDDTNINDDLIRRILKTSSKLRELKLCNCSVSYEGFSQIAANDVALLNILTCDTPDVNDLKQILTKWVHSLEKVDLCIVADISDALEVLAMMKSASRLKYIKLTDTYISQQTMRNILSNCPLLEYFDLSILTKGDDFLFTSATEIEQFRLELNAPLKC
ncbi:uncharacterized protein LOC132258095 [Phlebotomus argentipes]|uniref:uncharacterized protein LOC132258095 n=1 Tax=Phlebotomus argentipes TaxID=94469 RepID=UPI002892E861|nr:uncharacterized protein LOC132258095 [Phlebotomus argentipes]